MRGLVTSSNLPCSGGCTIPDHAKAGACTCCWNEMVASVWGSSQSVLYNGVEFQRAQFQQGSSNYHYAMGICNNGMQLLCDSYGEEQNTQLLMNENNATGQSD